MRFKDSPVVELPVGGAVLSFEQDNSSFHVGTSVWPCSLVLVKFVERWLPPKTPKTLTLTLAIPTPTSSASPGSAASSSAPAAGPRGSASSASASTSSSPTSPPSSPPSAATSAATAPSSPAPPSSPSSTGASPPTSPAPAPFDFVVAADVVYLADSAPHLVAAIDALLAPRGLLLLAYQLRSPDAHRAFWDLCARAFPVVVKVPRDHLHPDYAFDEADVYLMQRQQT
uniref:Uncharacterized protein n=1 Tax=Ananas comosus var. bracteatus TaxID=296719 RepID=A0A6V7NZK8_ANACO|nr:unnamed protein product [Ananas comosus var. bracteatus]